MVRPARDTRAFHVFSGLTGAAVVKLVIDRKWISNFERVNKEYERFTLNRGNGLHYYLHHEHCYAPPSLSLSSLHIRSRVFERSYEACRITRVSYLRIGKRPSSCLSAIRTNIIRVCARVCILNIYACRPSSRQVVKFTPDA